MIPLCTTTRLPEPSVWGCAFSSVGRPWVAHRVWPMPMLPRSGRSRRSPSSTLIRPAARRIWRPSAPTTATPAES